MKDSGNCKCFKKPAAGVKYDEGNKYKFKKEKDLFVVSVPDNLPVTEGDPKRKPTEYKYSEKQFSRFFKVV